jgi:hypothetical protein
MSVVAGALGLLLMTWGVLALVAFGQPERPQDTPHGFHTEVTQMTDRESPAG